MLIHLDDVSGNALLDLLNTEAAFGTLHKSLYKFIPQIEEGLRDYDGHESY